MDPTSSLRSWYYVDSWKWVASTWGGSTAPGQWVQASKPKMFYANAWSGNFETNWAAGDLQMQGVAKPLVRRFRHTGSGWVREV